MFGSAGWFCAAVGAEGAGLEGAGAALGVCATVTEARALVASHKEQAAVFMPDR